MGKRVYPSLTWRIPTEESKVYITFDDGPEENITPWVLDELAKHNAKATFFMVGENAKSNPELVNRIVDEGHGIGNHTYHHIKGWGADTVEYIEDIAKCKEVIPPTKLFRPPYGRITSKSIDLLKDYHIIMWDVLSRDYKPNLNRDKAIEKIVEQTSPGSIVVFHDSKKAAENLKYMLPKFLDYLSKNNYKMEAL
ncbi:MAG: polysaccharide deacetylase family protein [Bacteroidia bacterium]